MGCSSCGTAEKGQLPKGCRNNGACSTGGCHKLNVFDWLANMEHLAGEQSSVVEVRFKHTRKEFFLNAEGIQLVQGDVVAVEGSPGHDVGVVSLSGPLVKMQLQRLKHSGQGLKKVFRKASTTDVERWKEAMDKEDEFRLKAREAASLLKLKMKISDVECQGDGSKSIIYYTADDRIDFRELIKILARDLRVKIEMRQIGLRQEAARLGGIGVCGRELCCSSWLRDFRTVSTAAARYQQLSINPQKLAGQCGKLKCCLNYELDSYMDALKGFPANNIKLKTKQGIAFHQKTDIFRKTIYYSYSERPDVFLALAVDRVQEILEMNKKGELPDNLEDWVLMKPKEEDASHTFSNVIEEGALDRFDGQRKKRKSGRKSGRRRPAQNQKSGQHASEN
ncbi:MAG: hypothetical protein FJZ75_04455 [Bacteroidetes bacterium]|nr:hypothetical protein [Bacteroidota bacterium]